MATKATRAHRSKKPSRPKHHSSGSPPAARPPQLRAAPGSCPAEPPTADHPALLACFLEIVSAWQTVFPQRRTYFRAVRQALGGLICLGRRTLTRILWTLGREQKPWRADYFLFSRVCWDAPALFTPILERALAWCPGRYLGVAIDDTRLRKTGQCIQQAFLQRDPLSPKYHVNLMLGLRFLQASLLVPLFCRAKVGTRALPIAFEESPVVKRPRGVRGPRQRNRHGRGPAGSKAKGKPAAKVNTPAKPKANSAAPAKASPPDPRWTEYLAAKKLHNLSTHFVELMPRLRAACNACGAAKKILLLAVDGSFCNRTVFAAVIPGVELIARARKNTVLCRRAEDGSRRFYATAKFTPEQIRLDESIPWQSTKLFYGGKRRKVDYKLVRVVYWQRGARQRPLSLLVVRPTRYRKRKSARYYYRDPAYLLTTVVHGTVRQLLQIYFDRWQIEVNHREEKDTVGIGQAQLWNVKSVPKQPAFAVAAYSAVLLAGLQAFGAERGKQYAVLPKWRHRAYRPSALDLVTLLRKEVTDHPEFVAPLGLHLTDRDLNSAADA